MSKQYNQLSDCSLFLEGDKIEIWYAKDLFFCEASIGRIEEFDPHNLEKTHVLLGTISGGLIDGGNTLTQNIESIFYLMQGEKWSPNGEANTLILDKDLSHTSMSVGDVIRIKGVKTKTYLCKSIGWDVFED
jgi:predicted amino acid dehydrogenase